MVDQVDYPYSNDRSRTARAVAQPGHSRAGLQAVADSGEIGDDIGTVRAAGERIIANIEQVIEGKAGTIRLGLAVLLA